MQCNSLSTLVSSSQRELVKYYHAVLFSPAKQTWLKAINKGFFIGWPGLNAKAVQKHLTTQVSTIMGHLKQTRQHVLSSKQKKSRPENIANVTHNITYLIYDPI